MPEQVVVVQVQLDAGAQRRVGDGERAIAVGWHRGALPFSESNARWIVELNTTDAPAATLRFILDHGL